MLNLYELTGFDSTAINEQIKNLRLQLNFKSSAKTLTAFENLPVGEFYIEDLYAELQHYPHAFHDFNADILIDKENLNILDFEGMVDESDFLFTGKLKHYDLWFKDKLLGETEIDLQSKEFQLLECLLRHKGKVVTRSMLLEQVWNYHFDPQTNVIDVHISRLRQKVDKVFNVPVIETVRGTGYRISDMLA